MVTWRHRSLERRIANLEQRTEHMATQADIDALTQQVDQVASDLQTSTAQVQAEIDALSQANPQLDLSALQAAVTPLDDKVKALGQITPTPPSPPAP
jgi:phage shock protein A